MSADSELPSGYSHLLSRRRSDVSSIIPLMGRPRPMKRGFISVRLGITLIAASAQMGFGQDPSLIVADTAFRQALAHSDAAGLGKLLDPDSKWIDRGGRVMSKAQVLRGMPKPIIGNEKDAENRA